MSIESLKQQARKHEQNEEWQKALAQYKNALAALTRDEQVDIGLYNRVGDLYVRVGGLDQAVEHYDKAVDLYREAYLPNNAIAVCKKIIRNVPERHRAYLMIGQIRAEQGFLPDARTHFLTYAERMAGDGDLDESFRALIEFCDLAPDEVGMRITVADQMIAQDMEEPALEQLTVAHQHYVQLGDEQQAADLKGRILAIDPNADVDAMAAGLPTSSVDSDGDITSDFGEIAFDGAGFDSGADSDVGPSMAEAAEEVAGDAGAEVDGGMGDFAISSLDSDDGDDEAFELPMMDFGSTGEDEGETVELPTMDFESPDGDEGETVELPAMDLESSEEDQGEAIELPTMDFESSDKDEFETVELPTMDFESPQDPAAELDAVAGDLSGIEVAPMEGASGLDAAGMTDDLDAAVDDADSTFGMSEPDVPTVVELDVPTSMEDAHEEAAAEFTESMAEPLDEAPVGETPAPAEPASAAGGGDGFVDFGAMILGDEAEKSTRFTVAYEEPSGDEQADFAKMLAQFKDKVSENLDSSDVRAHSDLGTAYKEMGLLDEAIASFQAALRASADHLPTYELMGQTFMEMGQPEAAVKSLERAIEVATTVEDELVGIYYYLGRAYEELGNRESAVEFFDRVFSLDINFADVTERLRELR